MAERDSEEPVDQEYLLDSVHISRRTLRDEDSTKFSDWAIAKLQRHLGIENPKKLTVENKIAWLNFFRDRDIDITRSEAAQLEVFPLEQEKLERGE